LPSPKKLLRLYEILLLCQEHRHWWPAKTPFEVCVGAILTQNCAWQNVVRAIAALKQNKLMSINSLSKADPEIIAGLIRPTGYFRQKTERLLNFVQMIKRHYKGNLNAFFARPTYVAREELLSIKGIGKETCDSMLLYAGGHPIFVVDAYTIRILSRHEVVAPDADYDEVQEFFHSKLKPDAGLFNDFHAQLVGVGAKWCRRKQPLCGQCPVTTWRKKKPVISD